MMKMGIYSYSYYEDGKLQILGLPYLYNGIYFYAILPKEKFGLKKLLNEINGKSLNHYIDKAQESHNWITEVDVSLLTYQEQDF